MKFIKKMFSPMQDDMSTTRYHAEQIARRRDIPEHEGEIVRGATEVSGIVIDSTDKALDYLEAQ